MTMASRAGNPNRLPSRLARPARHFNEPFLATRTHHGVRQASNPQRHIQDRVAKTRLRDRQRWLTDRFGIKETPNDSNALQVFGQTINYYDGDAFKA